MGGAVRPGLKNWMAVLTIGSEMGKSDSRVVILIRSALPKEKRPWYILSVSSLLNDFIMELNNNP
jgi:hypothetical protein